MIVIFVVPYMYSKSQTNEFEFINRYLFLGLPSPLTTFHYLIWAIIFFVLISFLVPLASFCVV